MSNGRSSHTQHNTDFFALNNPKPSHHPPTTAAAADGGHIGDGEILSDSPHARDSRYAQSHHSDQYEDHHRRVPPSLVDVVQEHYRFTLVVCCLAMLCLIVVLAYIATASPPISEPQLVSSRSDRRAKEYQWGGGDAGRAAARSKMDQQDGEGERDNDRRSDGGGSGSSGTSGRGGDGTSGKISGGSSGSGGSGGGGDGSGKSTTPRTSGLVREPSTGGGDDDEDGGPAKRDRSRKPRDKADNGGGGGSKPSREDEDGAKRPAANTADAAEEDDAAQDSEGLRSDFPRDGKMQPHAAHRIASVEYDAVFVLPRKMGVLTTHPVSGGLDGTLADARVLSWSLTCVDVTKTREERYPGSKVLDVKSLRDPQDRGLFLEIAFSSVEFESATCTVFYKVQKRS